MVNDTVVFPKDFDDNLWEYQAKGWVYQVIVYKDNHCYQVEVYTYHRFLQTLNDERQTKNGLFLKQILLVESIDKASILQAIQHEF